MKCNPLLAMVMISLFFFQCSDENQIEELPEPFPDPGPGEIDSKTQVIYLKFLPDFSEVVEEFGLQRAEVALKNKVRARVRQNLKDYNFAVLIKTNELELASPEQVATIEMRGYVPDGDELDGLFSNDNSAVEKDTNNTVQDEYVGGFNEEIADFYSNEKLGHGGIFFGEWFILSEQISSDLGLGVTYSDSFDEIFKPISPRLSGTPLATFPESRDDSMAKEAIEVLGNSLAASITQLVGFLVGLPANGEPDVYFNEGDSGCFMDEAQYRPFEQRSGLDGTVEKFCPDNDEYLKELLPN